MKKRLFKLAGFAFCAAITLASCGDDDVISGGDPSVENDRVDVKSMTVDATAYNRWVYVNLSDGTSESKEIDPIAGGYSGDLTLKVAGESQGDVKDLKLEVTRVDKDSVNLLIKGLAFGKYGSIGDIASGARIAIDSINGKLGYNLEGGEVITSLDKYNVKAKSSGYVVGKDIVLNTTLQFGAMPMAVEARYSGKIEKGAVDESSFKWDLAFHRWDVKTNGGSGAESKVSSLEALKDIPVDGFEADCEIANIMVDNSGMASGKIGFATGLVNPVLSKWMNVDTGSMPPSYTMSDNVYLLKLSDGKIVKIKFTDYTDDKNAKGHISFDYIYPSK